MIAIESAGPGMAWIDIGAGPFFFPLLLWKQAWAVIGTDLHFLLSDGTDRYHLSAAGVSPSFRDNMFFSLGPSIR